MAKELSRAQVEGRKSKAERFVRDVLEDEDRADEIADQSVESYASRRGFVLANPLRRRKRRRMPNNNPTKADLEDIVDQVQSILESVYTPEASREDLAAAVGDALDQLSGEEEDEDLEDEDNGNGD